MCGHLTNEALRYIAQLLIDDRKSTLGISLDAADPVALPAAVAPPSIDSKFNDRLSNVFAGKISYRERVLNGKDGRWPIGCARDVLVYICTGQLPDLDPLDRFDRLSTRPDGSHWTDAYIKRLNLFANEQSLKINDETDAKQIGLVEVLTGIVVFQGMIDDLQPGERIELGNLVTLSNSGGVIELTYVPPNEYWSGSELTNEGMRELTRIALADHLAEISLATPEQTPAAALSLQTAPAGKKMQSSLERQKERWDYCVSVGLQMPKDTYQRYPRGIAKAAEQLGITRQSLVDDLDKYREVIFKK